MTFSTFISSTYKGEPDVGSRGPPKEIAHGRVKDQLPQAQPKGNEPRPRGLSVREKANGGPGQTAGSGFPAAAGQSGREGVCGGGGGGGSRDEKGRDKALSTWGGGCGL